jgi:hypothetical protein
MPEKWRTRSASPVARFCGVLARLDTVRGALELYVVRSSWIILRALVLHVVATGAQLSKVGGQSYVSITWLVPRVRLAST